MTRKDIEAAVEEAEAKGSPLEYQPTAGMRKLLDRLPEVDGTAAACFDTRFDKSRMLTGSAAKTMARKLGRRGYRIVADRRASSSWSPKGPSKRASWTAPVGGESPLGPEVT